MDTYKKTVNFWNQVFSQDLHYNPNEMLYVPEIEVSLQQLAQKAKTVLDFGCGHGRMLLRLISLGIEQGLGIDVSQQGIALALKIANEFTILDKVNFEVGSLAKLDEIDASTFQGAILFNVLDNLTIEDGKSLMNALHRIMTPIGVLLVKLNPYLNENDILENHLKALEKDLYQDENGLYLWNISNKQFNQIINGMFHIENEVNIPRGNYQERLFYLKKIER